MAAEILLRRSPMIISLGSPCPTLVLRYSAPVFWENKKIQPSELSQKGYETVLPRESYKIQGAAIDFYVLPVYEGSKGAS